MSSSTSENPVIRPRRMMRGHTHWVNGAVHLPGGRHIITCSLDGSLRLWDIESGTQIGEVWQDEGNGVRSIALSSNGKKIASGSEDGKVKLWDVETRKIIAKWTGHTVVVCALCWSGDGGQVASGSWDGTARVWDVDSGKNILKIKTGHEWVRVVMYSPDSSKLATGGNNVKIWDAKTGELLNILKHYNHDWVYLDSPRMSDQQDDDIVRSLTWTTDAQKLISGSYRLIRIFDTATWQQSAILTGHTNFVYAISLSQNNRLLASVSQDKTARLWNLDTNLQVGSPLLHEHNLHSAALSLDGKVLVTGCENTNAYAWDVHAILKEADLEDLLSIGIKLAPKDRLEQKASQDDSSVQNTPRSSLDDKSFLKADATCCTDQFGDVDELPPTFFAGMEAEVDSSPMGGAHPHSSANALFTRLSSLLHRFRPQSSEANELLQTSRPSVFRPHALLARLSSLLHRFRSETNAPDELQHPSTPSQLDPHVLLAQHSSFLPRPRLGTDEEAEPHPTTSLNLHPDGLINRLSSFFRSQPRTEDELELSQGTMHSHAVEVPAMRDREVLFVAEPPRPNRIPTQPRDTTIPGTRPAHSLPLRMLAHLVLFLCCASPQRVGGDVHPAQQQEGQAQAHATSSQTQHQQGQLHDQSQTQPVALSMSATPTALDAHTTAPIAASGQPLSLPLRTRFVLFLCCASLPHAERE